MFSKLTLFSSMALAIGLSSVTPAAYAAPQTVVHVGQAVPYIPSGTSACGTTPAATEVLAGVSEQIFATFGGTRGAICGHYITVIHNGKTVTAKVDNTGAAGIDDLILSHPAYAVLDDINVVPIDVTWFVV